MAPRGLPTKSEQLDYLIQWFLEYSEVQRDDFLVILINKFAPMDEETLPDVIKILNMTDNPPSIFQCRMKLFNDWFINWSDEEKTDLLKRLKDIDDNFVQKFYKAVDNNQEPDLQPEDHLVTEIVDELKEVDGVEESIETEEFIVSEEFNETDAFTEADELNEVEEKLTNHLSELQNELPNEIQNEF